MYVVTSGCDLYSWGNSDTDDTKIYAAKCKMLSTRLPTIKSFNFIFLQTTQCMHSKCNALLNPKYQYLFTIGSPSFSLEKQRTATVLYTQSAETRFSTLFNSVPAMHNLPPTAIRINGAEKGVYLLSTVINLETYPSWRGYSQFESVRRIRYFDRLKIIKPNIVQQSEWTTEKCNKTVRKQ